MRIICQVCKSTYNIRPESLPHRKIIAVRCKKCGNLIRFVRPLENGADAVPAPSNHRVSTVEKGPPPAASKHDPAKVRALKRKIRMCLMGFIPPIAHVVTKAHMVMSDPYAGLRDLVEAIETDQGITTHALRVANSAYYGLSGRVTSIRHASVLLGNKIMGEIIAMAGARGFLGEMLRGYGLDSEILWRHSLAVAIGSKLLAIRKSPDLEQDAFSAGLLHDAGMIMLDPHIFEKKELFDEIMGNGSHTFLQAERMTLGLDHCEVCAEMFAEWGLPKGLLKPVAHHHRPGASAGVLGYAVHMADIMARRCGYGTGVDDMLYQADKRAMAFFDLEEEEAFTGLCGEISDSVKKIAMEAGEGAA